MSPDFAMCANRDCPSHLKCYRYTAKPGMRQSYMDFAPPNKRKRCDDFMPIRRTK